MRMTVSLAECSYDIILKRGALGRVGQLCDLNRKVLVASDTGVPAKYLKSLLAQCGAGEAFVFEAGEAGKSVEVWRQMLCRMHELCMGKDDLVVALGGGAVGDVAGFAAGCYLRGVPYVMVPTTTLAQADASVGGLVGINLCGEADLAGMLYHPCLVVADPDTLDTLPPRQYANGLAEVLKTGLVGSRELFESLENQETGPHIERLLYLALRHKISVVERDETGKGERRLLQFGQTLGRGIYLAGMLPGADAGKALLYGESLALGMLPMIESRTLVRRTRAVMRKLGLPLRVPYPAEQVMACVERQKAVNGDRYAIVRVKQAGGGYVETVDFEEVRLLYMGE